MDKEQIQDQELTRVTGGDHGSNSTRCYKCDKVFEPKESDGSFLVVKEGCLDYSNYYICPYCGYKRKIT